MASSYRVASATMRSDIHVPSPEWLTSEQTGCSTHRHLSLSAGLLTVRAAPVGAALHAGEATASNVRLIEHRGRSTR